MELGWYEQPFRFMPVPLLVLICLRKTQPIYMLQKARLARKAGLACDLETSRLSRDAGSWPRQSFLEAKLGRNSMEHATEMHFCLAKGLNVLSHATVDAKQSI